MSFVQLLPFLCFFTQTRICGVALGPIWCWACVCSVSTADITFPRTLSPHTLTRNCCPGPSRCSQRIHLPHSIIAKVWLPSQPDLLTLNQAEMEWADSCAIATAIKEPLLISVQVITSAAALLLRFSALKKKKKHTPRSSSAAASDLQTEDIHLGLTPARVEQVCGVKAQIN